MPIGTADVLTVGTSATALVDALFDSPAGTPLARPFLSPLMQAANRNSAQNFGGVAAVPFFNAPATPPPVLPATAVPNPALVGVQSWVSLLNPLELQTMLDMWWQIWNTAPGAVAPPLANPSDVAVLHCLRDYIADPDGAGVSPPLSLWVPTIAYDGLSGDTLRLRLVGYNELVLGAGAPLGWNAVNVREFLTYLAFGTHFVAIHAPRDLPAGPALQPFYTVFGGALGAASGWARMHSHYSGVPIIRGANNIAAAYAYPALVNSETTPANCPYLTALLIGRTAWSLFGNEYNTFFQLEGWPTTGVTGIGGRHGADFAVHTATKWNISTYGASVFSEKRGTTMFLAPPTWRAATGGPQATAGTIMVPYVGAETPQGWLDSKLIRL